MRSPVPPTDEFDAAAQAGGPRGVHRAQRSWWSRWWPFVVVLVVFPALAYGAVTFLSNWDGLPGADNGAQDTPDDTDEPDDGATEPTEPEVTPEVTPEPPPPPDLARAVEVYNATTTSGLASNARARLEEVSFTAVATGNWTGTDPPTSTIYYTTAADLGTAQMIASTLGITTIEESAASAPEAIIVVLVGDYVAT